MDTQGKRVKGLEKQANLAKSGMESLRAQNVRLEEELRRRPASGVKQQSPQFEPTSPEEEMVGPVIKVERQWDEYDEDFTVPIRASMDR